MVEIVLSTCELQHKLRSEFTASGSQGLASGDNDGAHPSKKHKKSTSQEVIDTLPLEIKVKGLFYLIIARHCQKN